MAETEVDKIPKATGEDSTQKDTDKSKVHEKGVPSQTKDIALCLSGGGFRATLYHLGVIRYLCLAGLLDRVRVISSVSGGSLLAAHLVLHWNEYLKRDWKFCYEKSQKRTNPKLYKRIVKLSRRLKIRWVSDSSENSGLELHPSFQLVEMIRKGIRSRPTYLLTLFLPLTIILFGFLSWILFSHWNLDRRIYQFLSGSTPAILTGWLASSISFLALCLIFGTLILLWLKLWYANTKYLWKKLHNELFQNKCFSEFPHDDNTGYDLNLMSVSAATELPGEGHSLVVVALVEGAVQIRIFDAEGQNIVDKPEPELIRGNKLTYLKDFLDKSPFPDAAKLSGEERREIIKKATSTSGQPHNTPKLFLNTKDLGTGAFYAFTNTCDQSLLLKNTEAEMRKDVDSVFVVYGGYDKVPGFNLENISIAGGVCASAAFPQVFQPYHFGIEGKTTNSNLKFTDGGVHDNSGFSPLGFLPAEEKSEIAYVLCSNSSATNKFPENRQTPDYKSSFTRLARVIEMVTKRLEFLQVSEPFTDIEFSNRFRLIHLSRKDPEKFPEHRKLIREQIQNARTDFNGFSELEIVHLVQAGFEDARLESANIGNDVSQEDCISDDCGQLNFDPDMVRFIGKRDLGTWKGFPISPPLWGPEKREALRRISLTKYRGLVILRIFSAFIFLAVVVYSGRVIFDDFWDSEKESVPKSVHNDEINAKDVKIASLTSDIDEAESKINALNQEKESLEATVETLNGTVTNLSQAQTRASSLSTKVEELSNDISEKDIILSAIRSGENLSSEPNYTKAEDVIKGTFLLPLGEVNTTETDWLDCYCYNLPFERVSSLDGHFLNMKSPVRLRIPASSSSEPSTKLPSTGLLKEDSVVICKSLRGIRFDEEQQTKFFWAEVFVVRIGRQDK